MKNREKKTSMKIIERIDLNEKIEGKDLNEQKKREKT